MKLKYKCTSYQMECSDFSNGWKISTEVLVK